ILERNPLHDRIVSSLVFIFTNTEQDLAAALDADDGDTQSATVHFKLLDEYAILVPAKLGNGRSIVAMIDTGSVETMVDSSLAKQLKLKSQEDVQVVLWEESLAGKRVTVDHIEIGNLAFANQSMIAADLGRFSADLHTPIDLIIGYNILCSL